MMMITLLLFLILGLIVLLAIGSFVQLLYLESLRLRSRDLSSLSYFKETLEDRIGLSAEDGVICFSLIKHSLLLLIGLLYFCIFGDRHIWTWQTLLESMGMAWVTMVSISFALSQLLYRRTKAQWLLPLSPALRLMALVVRPVVAILRFFQSLVELTDEKNGAEAPPTAEENIEALIDAGAEEGLIQEGDRKLIQSVVEFGDKLVREVMTPRPNIVAISAASTLEQLRQLVINEQFSRIPVYEESIDQVIGFVHVRDMFELEEGERARRTVRDLMRPIRAVPETKPVHDLLRDMQADGTHMVIVIDEYGNTAGLATMEDVVEVIVGEIRDEHEPSSDVTEDGHGGYVVSGNFDLARLYDLFEFRPDEDIESTTVGGMVAEWLGHLPAPGEVVERGGIRIEVLASDELRVEQVRISKSEALSNA
jgi:CBS domain containing-hemolysin-like protein